MPRTGNELCVPPNNELSSDINDDEPDGSLPPPVRPVNEESGLFDPLVPLPPPPVASACWSNDANSGDVAAELLAFASDELLAPVVLAMIWLISWMRACTP